MRVSGKPARIAAAALATTCIFGWPAWSADTGATPDLSMGGMPWVNDYPDYLRPKSGPGPVTWTPSIPLFVPESAGRERNHRVADLTNPILQPWVREVLEKENKAALAGNVQYTAIARCRPAGVPVVHLLRRNGMFITQEPNKVTFLYQSDHQVRHVYLNVPHSANVKPSYYGESVGHYEGDTLVVDTIGISTKEPIDYYQTPHTDKLHVVERFRVIDGGKILEVNFTVEDPGAFTTPWSASQQYKAEPAPRRMAPGERFSESVCAESESMAASRPQDPQHGLVPIPISTKPDF